MIAPIGKVLDESNCGANLFASAIDRGEEAKHYGLIRGDLPGGSRVVVRSNRQSSAAADRTLPRAGVMVKGVLQPTEVGAPGHQPASAGWSMVLSARS
ncbi:MAG: hypothetical protein KDB27_12970 [Planctomycetales bacterium]|nr:hypothetical protein [Planctomycetales bacterium]